MLKKDLLAKIGGGLSLVSLLFLPLGGCERVTVTGLEVLRMGDVGFGIKLMLIISILCAIGSFFLKTVPAFFSAGGGGLGGLLIAFVAARQSFPVEMKIGAFLAIIGFGLVLVEGFLQKGGVSLATLLQGKSGSAHKFCSQCGSRNDSGSEFCRECGAKFS